MIFNVGAAASLTTSPFVFRYSTLIVAVPALLAVMVDPDKVMFSAFNSPGSLVKAKEYLQSTTLSVPGINAFKSQAVLITASAVASLKVGAD